MALNTKALLSIQSFISKQNRPIDLLAVTKGKNAKDIEQLFKLSTNQIGENRLQEAQAKFNEINPQILSHIKKHFIGRLQSNKIKQIVKTFDVIQSVDSSSHLEKISESAHKLNKQIQIFLQLNPLNDPAKQGIKTEEILNLAKEAHQTPKVIFAGIMMIGKENSTPQEKEQEFKITFKAFQRLTSEKLFHTQTPTLSMGMSADYKEAIKFGSNMIRIGSALFE
jgi:pyridoxal phosphate enzyme (YggS family)